MTEGRNLPPNFQHAGKLLSRVASPRKERILAEARRLALRERCSAEVMALLELLGYAKCGRFTVPVFLPEHKPAITSICALTADSVGPMLTSALMELGQNTGITAARHGVDPKEIANELYHILFGSINEELAGRGIVATPPYRSGEGRYLKCVEVY